MARFHEFLCAKKDCVDAPKISLQRYEQCRKMSRFLAPGKASESKLYMHSRMSTPHGEEENKGGHMQGGGGGPRPYTKKSGETFGHAPYADSAPFLPSGSAFLPSV